MIGSDKPALRPERHLHWTIRNRLSEIVEDVASTGSEFVISRHGRPAAVVIGYEEYEALLETLNILSDADTMGALAEAEADLAAGDLTTLD